MKLLIVAGARPNFMKVAPLVHQLRKSDDDVIWKLVHTGQHYDYDMSKVFFEELEIPEPDYFLGAGSGTHAEQTAHIMVEFEKVCFHENPDVIVVVGDVNSTLACSVTAKKLNIKVAHVEAGLRSRDMTMPEEINRIVTDAIADYLFVTEKSGVDNLRHEGRREQDIYFVGNVMIDTLYYQLNKLKDSKKSGNHEIDAKKKNKPFAVVTLHRPSNVDDRNTLGGILDALAHISEDMPVIFPVHPRARKNIEEFDQLKLINDSNIELLPPMPYVDFMKLWKDASLVLTDSGGLQEETTALGIPCFTIRENTERPVTIEEGTNTLVGTSGDGILSAYEEFKNKGSKKGRVPQYWDGKAAQRILGVLMSQLRT
jgi:UDP-N-acetylglucosamine 2-epimerase (non-hydrolysing)